MTTQAKATFQITGWDEKPLGEEDSKPKLTKAHVTCTFSGDVEGEGVADYLMVYPTDDTATFVGLQRIDGQIGGTKGAVVLQVTGTFENGIAAADWSIVDGSATGGLAGITGKGGYESRSDGSADLTLDYTL
jgi:hypothetical protein